MCKILLICALYERFEKFIVFEYHFYFLCKQIVNEFTIKLNMNVFKCYFKC